MSGVRGTCSEMLQVLEAAGDLQNSHVKMETVARFILDLMLRIFPSVHTLVGWNHGRARHLPAEAEEEAL